MLQETTEKQLCAWCAGKITPIMGVDREKINLFPETTDMTEHKNVEGKTMIFIRGQIYYACSQEHARLYSELPRSLCHYPQPHKCKMEDNQICMNSIECNCPGKHIFCSEAAKAAFYNQASFLVDDSPLEDLNQLLGDKCSISTPTPDNDDIPFLEELLLPKSPEEPLISEYVPAPIEDENKKDTKIIIKKSSKSSLKRSISSSDFVKVCQTCKCGYGNFKNCIRCGQKICNICHSLNKCINCEIEGWSRFTLRVTGIVWMSNYLYNGYNVNKNHKQCPHCYIEIKEYTYLLFPFGHVSCASCANKRFQDKGLCGICSVNIVGISPVYLKYWSTREFTTIKLHTSQVI